MKTAKIARFLQIVLVAILFRFVFPHNITFSDDLKVLSKSVANQDKKSFSEQDFSTTRPLASKRTVSELEEYQFFALNPETVDSNRDNFFLPYDELLAGTSLTRNDLEKIRSASGLTREFFEEHPFTAKDLSELLLPWSADSERRVAYVSSHDLAFGEDGLLFVMAEFSRRGMGFYVVIAPTENERTIVEWINRTLPTDKMLFSAYDEKEASSLLRNLKDRMGVRYRVFLTSQETDPSVLKAYFEDVHVLTRPVRASAREKLGNAAPSLNTMTEIYRRLTI